MLTMLPGGHLCNKRYLHYFDSLAFWADWHSSMRGCITLDPIAEPFLTNGWVSRSRADLRCSGSFTRHCATKSLKSAEKFWGFYGVRQALKVKDIPKQWLKGAL